MMVVVVIHVLGERTSRSPAPFPLPSQVRVRSQLPVELVGGQHRGNWKETRVGRLPRLSIGPRRPIGHTAPVICVGLRATDYTLVLVGHALHPFTFYPWVAS